MENVRAGVSTGSVSSPLLRLEDIKSKKQRPVFCPVFCDSSSVVDLSFTCLFMWPSYGFV